MYYYQSACSGNEKLVWTKASLWNAKQSQIRRIDGKDKKQDGGQQQNKRENARSIVKTAVEDDTVGKDKGENNTNIKNENIDHSYLKAQNAGISVKQCRNHQETDQSSKNQGSS